MDDNCKILLLPSEILVLLLELLPGKDIISFSLTCRRFSDTCRNFLRVLRLESCWKTGISVEDFKTYLSICIDPILLTECRLTNCFWFSAIMLQNFIKKCENIAVLKISETKLNCGNLAHIFEKCKKITDLSLTLCHDDLKLSERSKSSGPNPTSNTILQSCLKDCCDNLKNLLKLELVLFHSSLEEMKILISACDNLTELVLIPVKDQDPDARRMHFINQQLFSEIEGKFTLNSLIVVNLEEDRGLLHRFTGQPPYHRYQEYLIFKMEMSGLKNHWNDASPCPAIKDTFSSLTFKHLRIPRGMFELWWIQKNLSDPTILGDNDLLVADGWYLYDPLENINLHDIKSVREPIPIFIKKGLKAPRAEMISCFFSNKGFSDFCQNHPHLKVLKLKAPPIRDDWGNILPEVKNQVVGEEWNSNSWENLSELQVLSIEPSLLAIEQKSAERPADRPGRKRKFGELLASSSKTAGLNPPRELRLLEIVINSCSRIEELEIGTFDVTGERICRIDGEDLSHISQCKLLKKLTLANINISDGVFFEEIFKECIHLESVRLKNLGSRLLCCFTKNLCASLPNARKLSTLCIFQSNMVPLAKLLDSIEQCPALIRLGLVTPSDDPPFKWTVNVLSHRLVTLCGNLKYLVAFFCVINIPKSHKPKVLKQLLQLMTPKRPSFCADIQAFHKISLEHESSILPFVHREMLVHCNSRVCVVPYDFESSLL